MLRPDGDEAAMGWTRDEIRTEMRKLGIKKHEMIPLLFPERAVVKGFPNMTVGFVDFEEWVNKEPEPLQRPLRQAIAKFRFKQAEYRQHVAKQLAAIAKRKSGHAILAEIKGADRMTLTIRPYRPENDRDINADSFALSTIKSTALGYRVRADDGYAERYANGNLVWGTGEGTRVIIEYSPDMWGKSGSAKASGPGSQPDEVLCHELVHAGREMKGLEHSKAVGTNNVDRKYKNEEEFVAIVVTNVYLSEKKQTKLRGTHDIKKIMQDGKVVGRQTDELPDPRHFLANSQGTSLEPYQLMEKIRHRQKSLWNALAAIKPADAAFNPMRDWEPQRQKVFIDI